MRSFASMAPTAALSESAIAPPKRLPAFRHSEHREGGRVSRDERKDAVRAGRRRGPRRPRRRWRRRTPRPPPRFRAAARGPLSISCYRCRRGRPCRRGCRRRAGRRRWPRRVADVGVAQGAQVETDGVDARDEGPDASARRCRNAPPKPSISTELGADDEPRAVEVDGGPVAPTGDASKGESSIGPLSVDVLPDDDGATSRASPGARREPVAIERERRPSSCPPPRLDAQGAARSDSCPQTRRTRGRRQRLRRLVVARDADKDRVASGRDGAAEAVVRRDGPAISDRRALLPRRETHTVDAGRPQAIVADAVTIASPPAAATAPKRSPLRVSGVRTPSSSKPASESAKRHGAGAVRGHRGPGTNQGGVAIERDGRAEARRCRAVDRDLDRCLRHAGPAAVGQRAASRGPRGGADEQPVLVDVEGAQSRLPLPRCQRVLREGRAKSQTDSLSMSLSGQRVALEGDGGAVEAGVAIAAEAASRRRSPRRYPCVMCTLPCSTSAATPRRASGHRRRPRCRSAPGHGHEPPAL